MKRDMTKKEILGNPSFVLIPDISDITQSYFKEWGLHFFGHASVKPNGEFSFSASSHDWPENLLVEKKVPPIGFNTYDNISDRVIFPTMDKGDVLGWTDEVVRDSKNRFSIINPMVITRKYTHHYEVYIFDLHDKNVYEKYLNHFDIFENFIHYHKDKAKKLIEKINRTPLRVNSEYLPRTKMGVCFNHKNTSTLPPLKKYYLKHEHKDFAVSAKEYQCLALLAHGEPFKQIAAKLNIELRTVETYFERLKKKVNFSTRHELSRLYWNNRILSEKNHD